MFRSLQTQDFLKYENLGKGGIGLLSGGKGGAGVQGRGWISNCYTILFNKPELFCCPLI